MDTHTPTPTTTSPATAETGYGLVAVAELVANGDDARTFIDKAADDALADSMRTLGCLVPLLVSREADGSYKILEGHRRYRAGKKLGLAMLPCRIFDPQSSNEIGLAANLMRQGLTLMDSSDAIAKLVRAGKNQGEIKLALGLTEKELRQAVKIGALAEGLKTQVRTGRLDSQVALALTAFPTNQQEKVLKAAGGAKNARAWDVRRLLQKDGVPVEYAIFAHDAYKGEIVEDLFATHDNAGHDAEANVSGRRFMDRAQFKALQTAALEKLMAERRDAGELVYLHKAMRNSDLRVNKHSDKRVKPATIFFFDDSSLEVTMTPDAQLSDWQNRVLNVETGELLANSQDARAKATKAKETAKAKALPPEEKAPFTKTSADWLKRDMTIAIAREVAKDAHIALAIAVSALLGDSDITTIGGDESLAFTTMGNIVSDKAYPAYKTKYGPILDKIDKTLLAADERMTLKKLIDMKPGPLATLFAALVAHTLQCDRYGNDLDADLKTLGRYFNLNVGDELVFSNLFTAGITKAGCLAWAKLLKMETAPLAALNRQQILSAIVTKSGSLEAAARKALPPLTGRAPSDAS